MIGERRFAGLATPLDLLVKMISYIAAADTKPAGYSLEQRGLSGSALTYQDPLFPFPDLKAQVIEYGLIIFTYRYVIN